MVEGERLGQVMIRGYLEVRVLQRLRKRCMEL